MVATKNRKVGGTQGWDFVKKSFPRHFVNHFTQDDERSGAPTLLTLMKITKIFLVENKRIFWLQVTERIKKIGLLMSYFLFESIKIQNHSLSEYFFKIYNTGGTIVPGKAELYDKHSNYLLHPLINFKDFNLIVSPSHDVF